MFFKISDIICCFSERMGECGGGLVTFNSHHPGRAKAEGLSEQNVAWFDSEFQLDKFLLLAPLAPLEY